MDRRWADVSAWLWGACTLAALAISASAASDKWLMVAVVATALCMVACSACPCRKHLGRFPKHKAYRTLTCHQPPAEVWKALSSVFDDPDLHHDAAPEFRSARVRWSVSCRALRKECAAMRKGGQVLEQDLEHESDPAAAKIHWSIRVEAMGDETLIRITETGEFPGLRARRVDRFKHGHACRVELVLKCLSNRLGERSPRLE
jgi:hypothetical protein